MRKLFVGRSDCEAVPVEYFLLAEELGESGEEYGVGVKRGEEVETIPGITVSHDRITSLLALLLRGEVTPVTARDVVEDWLLV